MLTLYGIKTCDTCRAALKWLAAEKIAHRFHDLRADGLAAKTVADWIAALGRDAVINRRSATWRDIPARERDGLDDKSAVKLALAHPTLIKRPVIDTGKAVTVGFDARVKASLAKAAKAK